MQLKSLFAETKRTWVVAGGYKLGVAAGLVWGRATGSRPPRATPESQSNHCKRRGLLVRLWMKKDAEENEAQQAADDLSPLTCLPDLHLVLRGVAVIVPVLTVHDKCARTIKVTERVSVCFLWKCHPH